MDFESARQSVLEWLEHFVEQPNSQLGGWAPCPYARAARLNQRVDIRPGQDPSRDAVGVDLTDHDVIVWIYDPAAFTADQFNNAVYQVNQDLLLPQGLFALADHPSSLEKVLGVVMNHGQLAMMLVQRLDKLQEHARTLARRGYYQGWPEEYLQQLFYLREDPRQ
jgi:hypothetical protein